jgi:hypothetical protein
MTESSQTNARPAGTAEWPGIEEAAGLLAVRVAAWNHFGYAAPESGQAAIPPLGERNAAAITAGHGAIEVIDDLLRDLHSLRGQLVSELRANEDALAAHTDAMLAESRARRDGAR